MRSEAYTPLIKKCSELTGLTSHEIITIAASGPKRYKCYPIAKRSGGYRTICQPSRELKILQYAFLESILTGLPIHSAATAYKRHSSIKVNATLHSQSRVIMKMDFSSFFPSVKVTDWKKFVSDRFPEWSTQDVIFSSYVMFWGEGGYEPRCLSIGAPTSPLVSNAMMFEFDSHLSRYADGQGWIYTRYADDITLSSKDFIDKAAAISAVQDAIRVGYISNLALNPAKTRLASKATNRTVTGLVINNEGQLSLGRDRKRLINSMVHHAIRDGLDLSEAEKLAGLLSFARHVEPTFWESLKRKYDPAQVTQLSNPPSKGL